MTLSPLTDYIFDQLAYWTMQYTNIVEVMSADTASYLGIVPAFLSGIMVTANSLRIRQIGALVFFGQVYLDSLDGYLARSQGKLENMDTEPGKRHKWNWIGHIHNSYIKFLNSFRCFVKSSYRLELSSFAKIC